MSIDSTVEINSHKQVIMDFLEEYRRDQGISLAVIIEICELTLQEGRVGLAITAAAEGRIHHHVPEPI